MRTGGQLLADGLVAHGSELAFCVPGESYLALPEGPARPYPVATRGRPGPVVLALPEDVLSGSAGVADAPRYRARRPSPDPAALTELAGLLERAQRPFVLVGGGPWDDRSARAF